jgi:hypothetical protein
MRVPTNRGHFVDVKTVAGALLSGSWSLGTLAEHLKTEHRKLSTDEHGGRLTREYLKYATEDVQVTWECFEQLAGMYDTYQLTETPLTKIFSEAGLGKAYLKQMGVRPWREQQPEFEPSVIGAVLSTYFGGRSEVHMRLDMTRVLYCDFLSMYPTSCILMDLWQFVIAKGMEYRDATSEVKHFLDNITLHDLQNPSTWKRLVAIVQIRPNGDIVPVRAKYDGEQYSIGVNHLYSEQPVWYTLADCLASKLLTGKTPEIVKAIGFSPKEVQTGLKPIRIVGNSDYVIDPYSEDLFLRLIELRNIVKSKRKGANDEERNRLETEQLALKICANATSYGIYVELNVTERNRLTTVDCWGDDECFQTWVKNVELPGKYFHPVIATLLTGAARLMLAITEHLADQFEIGWAFCDTDSMALANINHLSDADFESRVESIRNWFQPLSPYRSNDSLLKLEDANLSIDPAQNGTIAPLHCYAVSAKRYVLFNLDSDGNPVIRKASAHGLGHLLPPYTDSSAFPQPRCSLSDIGVERRQHDLWYSILTAELSGKRPQYDLPYFDKPAVSRYSATTAMLLKWFQAYNAGRAYSDQVKPFGFLLSFQAKTDWLTEEGVYGELLQDETSPSRDQRRSHRRNTDCPRVVAPFSREVCKASKTCFDRDSGASVPDISLKTYREALIHQYHLHPEAKFLGGEWDDRGITQRRHIYAIGIEHIGKEANRWEQQFYTGEDPEAQIVYGIAAEDMPKLMTQIVNQSKTFGQRALAAASGYSLREINRLLTGRVKPDRKSLSRLSSAIQKLQEIRRQEEEHTKQILAAVRERCQRQSLRQFCNEAGLDHGNVCRTITSGKGSQRLVAALERALAIPS